jgi:hypothetical protein
MKSVLRLLGSQSPGLALGLIAGGVLMSAHLEDRWDARMRELRGLCAARPAPPNAGAPSDDTREALGLLRDQVALLEARLAERPAAPEPVPAAPAPEAPAAPVVATPEQEDAVVQGQQVLDEALGRARWTEEDHARFRAATRAGTRADVEALEQRLSLAINSGQLRPALDGR